MCNSLWKKRIGFVVTWKAFDHWQYPNASLIVLNSSSWLWAFHILNHATLKRMSRCSLGRHCHMHWGKSFASIRQVIVVPMPMVLDIIPLVVCHLPVVVVVVPKDIITPIILHLPLVWDTCKKCGQSKYISALYSYLFFQIMQEVSFWMVAVYVCVCQCEMGDTGSGWGMWVNG